MAGRIDQVGDLWPGMMKHRRTLGKAVKRLRQLER
jgi:hypothetical protein